MGIIALPEERVQAFLTEMQLQIPKVQEGLLTAKQFQALVDSAKAVGVPRERIEKLLTNNGVTVVSSKK